MRELDRILSAVPGHPVGQHASPPTRTGNAYYADIGAIPNVPDAKAQQLQHGARRRDLRALGLPVLDGSRSACDWDTDPDAVEPGIFGPSHLPIAVPRRLRDQLQRQLLAVEPGAPARGLRADHRRRAHRRARCARGSG